MAFFCVKKHLQKTKFSNLIQTKFTLSTIVQQLSTCHTCRNSAKEFFAKISVYDFFSEILMYTNFIFVFTIIEFVCIILFQNNFLFWVDASCNVLTVEKTSTFNISIFKTTYIFKALRYLQWIFMLLLCWFVPLKKYLGNEYIYCNNL